MSAIEPWLVAFADESNKIEGMGVANVDEVSALAHFIDVDRLTVDHLIAYVNVVAPGHRIRDRKGLNVRVGNHIAPAGGPSIPDRLSNVLLTINIATPHQTHCSYETLHPFTDGNGRSGRALWLWQHLNSNSEHATPARVKQLGFLHTFYYETLAEGRP